MDYHKIYDTTYNTYFSIVEKLYKKKYIKYKNDGYTFNLTYNELNQEHWNYIKLIKKHLDSNYKEDYVKLFNERFQLFENNQISNIIEKRIKPLLRKNKEQTNFDFEQFVCKIAKLDALKETSRLHSNNSRLFDLMYSLNDFRKFELKQYSCSLENLPLFEKLRLKVYPPPKQSKSKIIIMDNNEDEYLTVQEVAELTNYRVPTIYDLKHKGKIPFYKKGAKLQFKKSEILKWIENGKGTTRKDLEAKANEYILKNS